MTSLFAKSSKPRSNKPLLFFCHTTIIVGTLLTYLPIKDNDFINFDDNISIFENDQVRQGLSWNSTQWALTNTHTMVYWHPLLWLSHMVDYELFGLWPAMHHLHNLLLHLCSALLLFWCLYGMTAKPWPSVFVALTFAVHPMQVESVAWATERSNTLSGLYWMLAMAAYVRFATRPGVLRYLPVFVFMALGLMCKPILVTLPFALLLLDIWPLRRIASWQGGPPTSFAPKSLVWLLLEKVPLLVLSAASVFISVVYYPDFISSLATIPPSIRLLNIPVVYLHYLGKVFWPETFAVLERFVPTTSYAVGLGSAGLLVGISLLVIWQALQRPFLFVGWFWYLGILVPTLNTVWNGTLAWTYRMNYLPIIGILIVLAYGFEALRLGRKWRVAGCIVASLLVLTMAFRTTQQIGYWKNDATFFSYNQTVDPDSVLAYAYYAGILDRRQCYDMAIWNYHQALSLLKPSLKLWLSPIGALWSTELIKTYIRSQLFPERLTEVKQLLADNLLAAPTNADVYYDWGLVYESEGDNPKALVGYEEAVRLQPDHVRALDGRGRLLEAQGDTAGAIEEWRAAIWFDPNDGPAHFRLCLTLALAGHEEEAFIHAREVIRLSPDWIEAQSAIRALFSARGRPDLWNKLYRQ